MSSDDETTPPTDATEPQHDATPHPTPSKNQLQPTSQHKPVSDELESAGVDRGVEALEDTDLNLFDDDESNDSMLEESELDALRSIDEDRSRACDDARRSGGVAYAPKGFVDMRSRSETEFRFPKYVNVYYYVVW